MIDLLALRWQRALEAGRARSHDRMAERAGVRYESPATDKDLDAVQRALGRTIPASVAALYRISKSVNVWWDLGDTRPPKPYDEIFAGDCAWDLDHQGYLIDIYDGWVREVFSNAENPYDRVWHEKFPVLEVGNGDLIAVDLDGRPTYLSHDDGEGHGFVLGRDMVDFIDRWSRIGCPGPEDWQWLPFAPGRDAYIDPDGESAQTWRTWFGLVDE